jgi:hypothetical protein
MTRMKSRELSVHMNTLKSRVAVAISPRATSPAADTAPTKIVARLVDSVIAAVLAR